MDWNNADGLQSLRDAQAKALAVWQQFLSDISPQPLSHLDLSPMVTLLRAYRAQAQALADQYPDNPFPKACIAQADLWIKAIEV
jgi:hypothetical protein